MALKTVILTPYRPTPEREPIWRFVQAWIATNYDIPVTVADSDGPTFSPAKARNLAARKAGDWDVALFHDADTIAHPEAVTRAVQLAATTNKMVVAADSHMYCDKPSTRRIMWSGVPMFPRPDRFDEQGIYQRPCSGIFAISRETWNMVGGYVETLKGYGYEDLVFLQSCGIFADGHTWIPGHITLHMWHPHSERNPDTQLNKAVWQKLTQYRRRRDTEGARQYLQNTLGHEVP